MKTNFYLFIYFIIKIKYFSVVFSLDFEKSQIFKLLKEISPFYIKKLLVIYSKILHFYFF